MTGTNWTCEGQDFVSFGAVFTYIYVLYIALKLFSSLISYQQSKNKCTGTRRICCVCGPRGFQLLFCWNLLVGVLAVAFTLNCIWFKLGVSFFLAVTGAIDVLSGRLWRTQIEGAIQRHANKLWMDMKLKDLVRSDAERELQAILQHLANPETAQDELISLRWPGRPTYYQAIKGREVSPALWNFIRPILCQGNNPRLRPLIQDTSNNIAFGLTGIVAQRQAVSTQFLPRNITVAEAIRQLRHAADANDGDNNQQLHLPPAPEANDGDNNQHLHLPPATAANVALNAQGVGAADDDGKDDDAGLLCLGEVPADGASIVQVGWFRDERYTPRWRYGDRTYSGTQIRMPLVCVLFPLCICTLRCCVTSTCRMDVTRFRFGRRLIQSDPSSITYWLMTKTWHKIGLSLYKAGSIFLISG